MYGAIIINENVIEDGLTGYFVLSDYNSWLKAENNIYQVISITGLEPPVAQLNFTKASILDGAFYNSATLPTRNIVINLKINNEVERIRNKINNICRVKDKVRFQYKTSMKEVYIEGYVESVTYNLFERSEIVQISLICPSPNFKSLSVNTHEETLSGAEVFYLTNNSSCDVGFKLTVTFNSSHIAFKIRISTKYYIAIENYTFSTGDVLTINAFDGYYSCILTKASDSKNVNLIPYLTDDSTFAKLPSGINDIAVIATPSDPAGSSNSYTLKFEFNTEYRGI